MLPSLDSHQVRLFRAGTLIFVVVTTTEDERAKKLIALGVGGASPSRCSTLGDGGALNFGTMVNNIVFFNTLFEGVKSLQYCLHTNMIISSTL